MAISINLKDPNLFGKFSAEDEEESIFSSYQLERPELSRLVSNKVQDNLVIISAFRGEGKSALLRMATNTLYREGKVFLNRITSTAITLDKNSPDVAVLTRLWKSSIYNYVAKVVGSKIGFAWQDDSIGLVEFAQKEGFKSKPWLIALYDRFKLQIPGIPTVEHKSESLGDAAEQSIKRWSASNESFWLFIDDIDANFKDTKEARAKLMAFFQALREIRNETPTLKIRATLRPNIRAILRSEYPDSGKLNDYMVDLNWSEDQIRDLIAVRIKAYLARNGESRDTKNPRQLIRLCFQDPMQWAGHTRPPHTVLNTFSRARPRWVIEICTAAAALAVTKGHSQIELQDLTDVMADVGKERQLDLASEYEPQCKQIGQILSVFQGEDHEYETPALFSLLQHKLLDSFKPEITGAGGSGVTPQVVTRLLFEIGFLTARKADGRGYMHISFADAPNLLTVSGPVAPDISWEIPPIFRQALGLRRMSGKYRFPRSH